MTVLARDPSQFVSELDAANEAHLEWTRRVLRCAVLHTSPGDDVLAAVGPEESMAEALERADWGLYAAKAAGRDRWVWDRR